MIYFCADDYGLSVSGNRRIETCLENGILNKVSVIPNGEIADFQNRLLQRNAFLSLHINLVEGRPLSNPEDVPLLVTENGEFRHSFIGLLLCSISPKRKEFEKQIYKELRSQVAFWKQAVGEDKPISIDSHQHPHMIPLIFKTLLRVIREEKLSVQNLRLPAEPLSPYLLTPSLYLTYSLSGIAKQWLLKILARIDRKEYERANIPTAYFMGAMFSGQLSEEKIQKVLPRYQKLAEKYNRDIEINFHPGYVESAEELMDGYRKGFEGFYLSPWRKVEYDTLLNAKFKNLKEGSANALY